MPKKMPAPETGLHDVVVDTVRPKKRAYNESGFRKTPKMNRNSDFVYVNPSFVGSVNSVNSVTNNQRLPEPPRDVIREQYWACSRWPYTQRVLAAAVGVLLGAVIGLALTMALRNSDDNIIGGIFRSSAPD